MGLRLHTIQGKKVGGIHRLLAILIALQYCGCGVPTTNDAPAMGIPSEAAYANPSPPNTAAFGTKWHPGHYILVPIGMQEASYTKNGHRLPFQSAQWG